MLRQPSEQKNAIVSNSLGGYGIMMRDILEMHLILKASCLASGVV